jgi:hypothetical protein
LREKNYAGNFTMHNFNKFRIYDESMRSKDIGRVAGKNGSANQPDKTEKKMKSLPQPEGTYRSPFTGQDIDAHLVRREVAANLAVKCYVMSLFGLTEPEWTFTEKDLS